MQKNYFALFSKLSMKNIPSSHRSGVCHLCGIRGKKLHKKSHIIPDWMYREIKLAQGDRHLVIDMNQFAESVRNYAESGVKYIPPKSATSPHDLRWYCKDCEKRFEKLDDFAAKVVKGGKSGGEMIAFKPVASNQNLLLGGIVNHPFAWKWNLFVLSLVFRFHQSDVTQYQDISFGSNNIAIVKELLLKDTFDERVHNFHVVVLFPYGEGEKWELCFSTPTYGGYDKNSDSHTLFWGIGGFWFIVSDKRIDSATFAQIDTKDTVHFYALPREESVKFVKSLIHRQIQNQ